MLGEIVIDDKNSKGFPTREWRKVGPNHYFDNAKYLLAARYVLMDDLRKLAQARSQANQQPQEPEVYGQRPDGWQAGPAPMPRRGDESPRTPRGGPAGAGCRSDRRLPLLAQEGETGKGRNRMGGRWGQPECRET